MEVQRESVICSRCHSWWPIDNITLVWLLLMYFLPRHRHRRKRFGACLRSSVHAHTAVFHAAVRKGLIYAYLIGTATVLSLNLRNKGLGERLGFPPNPPPRQTGKPEWSCKRSWEIACMTSWWCFRAVIDQSYKSFSLSLVSRDWFTRAWALFSNELSSQTSRREKRWQPGDSELCVPSA